MSLILKSKKGHVGYISLNNPKALNALSHQMEEEVIQAIEEYDKSEEIRCIILKGEGRAFCSGHDLTPAVPPHVTTTDWRDHARDCNKLPFAIWHCSTPIVAQVHKYCMGGSCAIAAACDITIASEDTVFAEPEIQFNSEDPFQMLAFALPYKFANEILLTGERFSAQDALRMGLINKVVPMEELDKAAYEFALKLVKVPVPGMQTLKNNIKRIYELRGFTSAMHIAEEAFGLVLATDTPETKEFDRIRNEKGLAAAFAWRDEYFANPEKMGM